MEGEQHGVGGDEEALDGHEVDVGVGAGEEGEGGGEMSCMAARHHPTDSHWRRKVKVGNSMMRLIGFYRAQIFLYVQGKE